MISNSTIEVVESTAEHVRELSKTLRFKDRLEAERAGLHPEKGLFYSYRWASWRHTGLVNGKVAAMWGLHGVPLGYVGKPYLITGEAVNEISPIKFARIYKQEVQTMKQLFPILENYVDVKYKEAVRMLEIAGFNIGEPELFNGSYFSKFSIRQVD